MDLLWLLSSSFLSAAAGWWLYGYFARQGQFHQLEEVKFQLLHDDERFPPQR